MTETQPMTRVRYIQKEFARIHDDTSGWTSDDGACVGDVWVEANLIQKTNGMFQGIMDLDFETQKMILKDQMEYDAELDALIDTLIRQWLELGRSMLPHVERLERETGKVEGADLFRQNIQQAKDVLTPDSEFFAGPELERLVENAIKQVELGQTEPLCDSER